MDKDDKTFVSLFGGVGGFDLPLTKQGWRCVGYYEIDKYAVQTYNKNFKTKYEPADIRKVRSEEIEEHTMLCGGFPCQSFSIAGKRKGFMDTRGTLFFEIARIAKAKRSKILFLENVKGLLNHDKGKTFKIILQTLDELGYDVEWQVLNSKHFGVPQNRERVFIIGHLRGESGQKVFPIGEDAEEVSRVSERKIKVYRGRPRYINGKRNIKMYEYDIVPTLSENCATGDQKNVIYDKGEERWQMRIGHTKSEYAPLQYKSKVTRTLEANGSLAVYEQQRDGMRKYKGYTPVLRANMGTGGNNVPMVSNMSRREVGFKEVCPTLAARDYKDPKVVKQAMRWVRTEKGKEARKKSKEKLGKDYTPFNEGHRKLEPSKDNVSGCVTNALNKDSLIHCPTITCELAHQHGRTFTPQKFKEITGELRRLTPIECERLQGFPDNWTDGVSDTQRYKQMGNAVTINVIEEIVKRMEA